MSERRNRRETLIVLYDAECALCIRAIGQLADIRGARAELRFVPLQALEAGAEDVRIRAHLDLPEPLKRLEPDKIRSQMHVVQSDGVVFAGAEAVVRIMRELPGWRLMAWMYRVPGLKQAADAAYRYVARRRYDWFGKADEGCAGGSCALDRVADGAEVSGPRS